MRTRLPVALLALLLLVPVAASADTIRVQSTTDTVDAGLVGRADADGKFIDCRTLPGDADQPFCLLGEYAKKYPDDRVKYVGVGTGQALDNAKAGLADVVITHAASLEAQFVADGYAFGNAGRQIFFSDYVIVGPKAGPAGRPADPAGVKAGAPGDAVRAFELIAAAGAANPATTRFRSRANNSGTNVQEQIIWKLTGDSVPKQQATAASNPANDPTRAEPAGSGGAGTFPDWYIRNPSGQAANLTATEACVVAGNGCYTMIDRGTYDRNVDKGTVPNLQIVSEEQSSDAPGLRGGKDLLVNPFSAYVLNPDKFPEGSKPNTEAGRRFVNFIVSAEFQNGLRSFPNAINPAFRPDAFQTVTIAPALPATVVAGTPLTISGTIANALQGGRAVAQMPLRLQASTDGGQIWADIASSVTDAAGKFTLTTSPTESATYRLALPQFSATGYSDFTENKQVLGPVSVTPAVAPTATASPTVTPPADTTAPRVSAVKLTRKKLSLSVDEAADVRVVIRRKNRKGKFATVRTLTLSTSKAGVVRKAIKKLGPGRYRLAIRAEDGAGNSRTSKPTVRL